MRNPSQQVDVGRTRVAMLCLILALWVVIIAGRLVQLQVLKHESYLAYANSQQTRQVPMLAPRGAIYDRNGNPLAVSLEHESIAINPMRVPDPALAAKQLASTFGLDAATVQQKIERYKNERWGFMWIRRWASADEVAAAKKLKGADWLEYYKESKRYYPKRELASHVIGSVGVEGTGLFGLEQSMNYLLQGDDGDETVLQDVRRRPIQSQVTKQPRPGISLRLTLDQRVQHAAETALRKAIKENNVPAGSIVVMDPNNGDILAMASYPEFDPNERPKSVKELEHRFNRAISLEYEPGSVFKIITLAAGLEKTRYRPESIINCGNGALRLPGRTIRDHHAYSALSFAHVLAKSSNIGSINIAFAVGKDQMYDYVRKFGFGDSTGLPLPYERPGYVWPMHTTSQQRVYGSILASVAMGHQVSATTVQLAQACSVIANGGTLVKPRMVMEYRSPDGESTPVETKRAGRAIQPETAITMRKLMEGVMLEGTGKGARLPGWTAGGKTGTAQIFDLKQKRYLHLYHSSFLGFAPLQNPAIVVAVTLSETRQYGGTIAAPVFKEVASETLRILGVPMDNPATVLASSQPVNKDEVREGDVTLAGEKMVHVDPQLLPDTKKQVLAMLTEAMKEDPDLEEWVIGNARKQVAASYSTQRPLQTASPKPTNASREVPSNTPADGYAMPTWGDGAAAAQQPGKRSETQALADSSVDAAAAIPVNTLVTPDFTHKSMREVMAQALEAGVEVQVYGRGTALQQIPAPGTRIRQDTPIRVMFAP
jgi:cell division protein FtsI (penicillin-binding protein 3)